MKCINCGLPLSPNNTSTHCPHCHTALASGPKAAVTGSSQQYDNHGQGQTWQTTAPPNQFPLPSIAQTPFPQPGQMWQPAPTPPSLRTPPERQLDAEQRPPVWGAETSRDLTPEPPITHPPDRVLAPIEARYNSAPVMADNHMARTLSRRHSTSRSAARFQRQRSGNLGFIVAGLCLITGGLLLVFVHFMALGLPPVGTASVFTGTPVGARNTSSSPAAATPSPTFAPSPTSVAFPGQQYIDNPQLATMVNTNTAQPTGVATTFKVNQRIFVTFNIHPNGKNGAVCLFWYLNSRVVTQYPFSVTASANAGYSFAVYEGAGRAYVEIYWASSTACTDKILAQQVNFTVTR